MLIKTDLNKKLVTTVDTKLSFDFEFIAAGFNSFGRIIGGAQVPLGTPGCGSTSLTHVTGGKLHDVGATLGDTDSITGDLTHGIRFTTCTWTSGAEDGST